MLPELREATVEEHQRRSIMKLKSTHQIFAALAVAAIATGVASTVAFASGSTSTHAAVAIRHQTHGCHAWSVDGGAYAASHVVTLHRGGTITVTNNDVMPHQLVKTSGPAITITREKAGMSMGPKHTYPAAMLARMGASAKLTFTKAGTYKLTTKPGEDYMNGIKTIGADNVLRLKVVVS
jgi:plastocyanin